MGHARRNLVLLLISYGLVVVRTARQVLVDWQAGGSEWRQGDWLINAEAGPIRRGLFGSGLIAISDASGLSLLALSFALPLALLAGWIVALTAFAAREGPDDRLLLMLLSPGLVLFWGSDPEGILRKELLVYAAFLPLVFAAGRPRNSTGLLVVSVALYALAAAGHEIATFFAPAMILAIALCRPRDRASDLAMVAVAVLAIWAFLQALRHAVLTDAGPVCAPLLVRGLAPEICTGAIAWLAHDAAFLRDRLVETWNQPRGWSVPIAYALALLPFVVALRGSPRPWRGLLAIAALGLPFLPLWGVAIDWGRWINAHVSVLAVIALILIRRDPPDWLRAPVPGWLMVPVLILCLTFGIRHTGAGLVPGLVPLAAWLGLPD